MILSERDEARMIGLHPDLQRVIRRAARDTPLAFTLLETVRTPERQKQLVAAGSSWTMRSRHIPATSKKNPQWSHAFDATPLLDIDHDGKIETEEMFDWPLIRKLAPIIKAAAKAEGVQIEWGGDWRKRKDGPHWQLPWSAYP
jgi:peptidoglycan L-alanyl-D-glutamate endopeptidase CwlK